MGHEKSFYTLYHAAHGAIEDGLIVGGRRMLTTLLQTFVENTLEMLKTLQRAQFFNQICHVSRVSEESTCNAQLCGR